MGQGAALPGQRTQGAPTSHHWFLHDKFGARRRPAEIPASRGSIVKELERVDRPVDPKDIDIVILSGLTPQYDAEFCVLESSSDSPAREWIERAVTNQYERLECEKSAAGSRPMLSARGHRRNV